MDKVMKFEELKRVRSLYGKCARGTSLGEERLLYFSSFRARTRVLEIPPFALIKQAPAAQAIPCLNLQRSYYCVFSFGFGLVFSLFV